MSGEEGKFHSFHITHSIPPSGASDSPQLRPTDKPSLILNHHLPKCRYKEVFLYLWTLCYSFIQWFILFLSMQMEGLSFGNKTTQCSFDVLPVIVPLQLFLCCVLSFYVLVPSAMLQHSLLHQFAPLGQYLTLSRNNTIAKPNIMTWMPFSSFQNTA